MKKALAIYKERGYRTRLLAAAYRSHLHWSEFIGGEPAGQLTPVRFDLALVDGAGRIEILENAFAA